MWRAFSIAVVVIGFATPAWADSEQDLQRCNQEPNPDIRIGACTHLIQSSGLIGEKLAIAFNNRGNAYSDKGHYDRAIQDFDQAIRLKPDYADAFKNRGHAYNDKGQYDRAIKDYNQAIRLKLDYVDAFYNRGIAYRNKGQYDRAIQDFDQATRLKPDYALALNGKAWLMATAPQDGLRNGAEAVHLAERAFSLNNAAAYLDTLAAAHAEAGDFAAAIDLQQRAIQMLGEAGKINEIRDFRSRLDLYRQSRPYREK